MSRISEVQTLYDAMLNSTKYYFGTLKPSQLPDGLAGIYAITDNATNQVLYVGKTTNLRRRLYTNHLMGPITNARLKKYLIADGDLPEIRNVADAKEYIKNNCYCQFVLEADMRKRGQLEGLYSYLLDVKYVDQEH